MNLIKKIFCAVLFLAVSSCSISLQSSGLSDTAESKFTAINHSTPKTMFSPTDEKVTYWVQLENNFVGSTKNFDVEWIGPDGKTFIQSKTKTVWGRNDRIIAELGIKNNKPSSMPGNWSVKLSLDGQIIDQATFEILGNEGKKVNTAAPSAESSL